GDTVYVETPSTRLDIMHVKDLYEDVAKGYGYEKFGQGKINVSQTTGGLMPITNISESLRDVMVGLGFTEVTTLTLSSDADQFERSGLPKLENVRVLNPITEDHTCLRSYMMPSLMRIFRRNKHRDLPQRIFEINSVVVDDKRRTHICGAIMNSKVSFTEIKSFTESVLREMGMEYSLKQSEYRTFIPGRGADIICGGKTVGFFGEVSPQVITDYEITHPVAMFEIDLTDYAEKHSASMF
ncbi:MAG: phenylalanine--tRNA ligase subunit beta, partial [Candidatus Methanomethylophilaceae archaeon]|nr:phenylalanine--tRNA ligase subunit beta [Candidatus Methanomethylophilaceae archaeon]